MKIQIYAEKIFIEMETHEGTYCVDFSNRGPFGLREKKPNMLVEITKLVMNS